MSTASQRYSSYDEVPWYRKQGNFWGLYLVCSQIALGLLISGDVYYQKKAQVRSFGLANRIVAGLLALLILMGIAGAILHPESASAPPPQVVPSGRSGR